MWGQVTFFVGPPCHHRFSQTVFWFWEKSVNRLETLGSLIVEAKILVFCLFVRVDLGGKQAKTINSGDAGTNLRRASPTLPASPPHRPKLHLYKGQAVQQAHHCQQWLVVYPGPMFIVATMEYPSRQVCSTKLYRVLMQIGFKARQWMFGDRGQDQVLAGGSG